MNELTASKDRQATFLNNLRQQTAPSHIKLEENTFSKALLDPAVTLQNYQTYLAKMYAITLACEKDIFPLLKTLLPDIDQRFKARMIAKDLENTGLSLSAIGGIPEFQFSGCNVAQAIGVMYVLEGSTLGGRILYKHINQFLQLDTENGASYFWGYGQQTSTLWKAFVSVMSEFAIFEDCQDELISSSVETFSLIDNWLTESKINL